MEELNRISKQEFVNASKIPIVIVLDNIRSQNNTGSIFRSADAFRIEALYLCGITATPPHREIHKTALGATESVLWRYFPESTDALLDLISKGYQPVAVEQAHNSIPLNHYQKPANIKLALVFGNEIDGVNDSVLKLCTNVLEIPQSGTKHSLNIAVSVGIVLWHLCKNESMIQSV
jgi:tRNA G18 (ribose-2'-O)-methylase SpoU